MFRFLVSTVFVLGSSLSLASGAAAEAPADTVAATPAAAPANADQDKAKRVCRSVMLTGTRMSKRYCRTQAEWDHEAEMARRQLQDGQSNASRDGAMNRGGL